MHNAHSEVVDVRLLKVKRSCAPSIVGKQQGEDAAVAAILLLGDALGELARPAQHILALQLVAGGGRQVQ